MSKLVVRSQCEPPLTEAPEPAAAGFRDLASLPFWIFHQFASPIRRFGLRTAAGDVEVRHSPNRSLMTIRTPQLRDCAPLELQRSTIEAYRAMADILRDLSAHHPVRFWNFVPAIRGDAGDGLDRYMVFNAGRFAALTEWFGEMDSFDRLVATSTGVGHDGADLMIHVLAADQPGIHLMNPRQIAPRCYSRRYGPFPPCFARATLVSEPCAVDRSTSRSVAPGDQGWLILVGGTSAVRGEHSVCEGDLRGQTVETFRNLEALIRAVQHRHGRTEKRINTATNDPLRLFRTLRVYHSCARDERALRSIIGARFPHLREIEYLRADICRRELLVEIEGTAVIGTIDDS